MSSSAKFFPTAETKTKPTTFFSFLNRQTRRDMTVISGIDLYECFVWNCIVSRRCSVHHMDVDRCNRKTRLIITKLHGELFHFHTAPSFGHPLQPKTIWIDFFNVQYPNRQGKGNCHRADRFIWVLCLKSHCILAVWAALYFTYIADCIKVGNQQWCYLNSFACFYHCTWDMLVGQAQVVGTVYVQTSPDVQEHIWYSSIVSYALALLAKRPWNMLY